MQRWLLEMTQGLGVKIRKARKDAGLSQSQLAGQIGAHFTSVSDWERGRNVPSTRYVLALAEATGKDPEYFFEQREDDDEADRELGRRMRAVVRDAVAAQLRQRAS
jgi:transcriptional regulator with XRE-family HTH domain